MTLVRLEPAASRSQVKHSTTALPKFHLENVICIYVRCIYSSSLQARFYHGREEQTTKVVTGGKLVACGFCIYRFRDLYLPIVCKKGWSKISMPLFAGNFDQRLFGFSKDNNIFLFVYCYLYKWVFSHTIT